MLGHKAYVDQDGDRDFLASLTELLGITGDQVIAIFRGFDSSFNAGYDREFWDAGNEIKRRLLDGTL